MIFVYISAVVLCLFLSYLFFFLRPRLKSPTPTEALRGDYAHRGLHGNGIAENTLTAFTEADRHGFGMEFDLRLSADGQVVVFHDDTLERMCGRPERVDSLTYEELKQIEIKGTEDKIPLFTDLLSGISGNTPLCIELKGSDAALCPKVAEILEGYPGVYSVESFNPALLYWWKKNRPEVLRGQLTNNLFKNKNDRTPAVLKFICVSMIGNFLSRPDYIAYNHRYANSFAVRICEKLFRTRMIAWTVCDNELMNGLKKKNHFCIFQNFIPSEDTASEPETYSKSEADSHGKLKAVSKILKIVFSIVFAIAAAVFLTFEVMITASDSSILVVVLEYLLYAIFTVVICVSALVVLLLDVFISHRISKRGRLYAISATMLVLASTAFIYLCSSAVPYGYIKIAICFSTVIPNVLTALTVFGIEKEYKAAAQK